MNRFDMPPPTRGSARLLLVMALAVLVLIVSAAILFTGYFRLSSDALTLRDTALASSACRWEKQLALNVGSLTWGAVKTGLQFAEIDPRARTALRSVRQTEFCIYNLKRGQEPPNPATMLQASDEAMMQRGWSRVVGVLGERQLIAFYVSGRDLSERRLKIAALILEGRRLILANACGNPESLLKLIPAEKAVGFGWNSQPES